MGGPTGFAGFHFQFEQGKAARRIAFHPRKMRIVLLCVVYLLGLAPRECTNNSAVIREIDVYSDDYYHNVTSTTHENRYMNLPYVEKHIYRNDTRFIFFAGLGGTGHHLIEKLLKVLSNHTDAYSDTPEVRHHLWNMNVNADALFTFHNKHGFKEAVKNVYHSFHSHNTLYNKIYGNSSHLKPAVYFALNCDGASKTGMISYPNFFVTQHKHEPNMNILAKVAELAGVDYRVVIMIRDPVKSMLSVLNRFLKEATHQQFLQYIDVFASSQMHLLRQIASTDEAFYTCVEYEKFDVHAKNIENRIFNLPATNWSFYKIAAENYHPQNKAPIVDLDRNFTKDNGKKGKKTYPITYRQIQEYIVDKMYDDYQKLLRVCEFLR